MGAKSAERRARFFANIASMKPCSLEEAQLIGRMREEGYPDEEIAFLLIRKEFTTMNLIELYEEKLRFEK